MSGYAVNEKVLVMIYSHMTPGELVDVDILSRQFKLKTENGDYWIHQNQILKRL